MENNSKKIALVTGACGFMGTHMVDYLVSKGYHVRATDLETADKTYLNKSDRVEFVPADITKKKMLPPLFEGVEKVFHLAALFKFGIPWKMLYKVNVDGTRNLCETAMRFPIKRLVVWSSGSVYGGRKSEEMMKEMSGYFPHLGRYELSKALQGNMALMYYNERGLPVTVIRPAAVYGPRGRYSIAFIIFLMARNLLWVIPGPKEYKGALVHVKDVVRAAEFISNKEETIGKAYNIVDDMSSEYNKGELLAYVAKILGKKMFNISIPLWLIAPAAEIMGWWAYITKRGAVITKESLEYLTANYIMDNAKIRRLGFKLLYPDTKAGIKETIEWYKKEGWIK